MNNLALILCYILGVVGLMAITLLPYRSMTQIYQHYRQWQSQKSRLNLIQILVIICLVSVSSYLSFFQWFRLAQCLLKTICGASASGGWMTVCLLGVIYVGFEIGLFGTRWIIGKLKNHEK